MQHISAPDDMLIQGDGIDQDDAEELRMRQLGDAKGYPVHRWHCLTVSEGVKKSVHKKQTSASQRRRKFTL